MNILVKLFLFSILMLGSCNQPNEVVKTATHEKDETSNEEESNEPPYKDTCQCNFKEFGAYKISNENYNIYVSGKGWNPRFSSCSGIFGEYVSNVIPPDTNIQVLKIHLLDIDKFEIPKNLTEYGNDSITKYVIAVYSWDKRKKGDDCIFDPYKTGKYPKPNAWIE